MLDASGFNHKNFVKVHILANLGEYIYISILKVDVCIENVKIKFFNTGVAPLVYIS